MTIVPEDTAAVVAVETPPEPKPVVVVKAKRAHAPVELKVAAGASAGTVTGVITWLLVTFVTPWHHGLPPALATFLPAAVAVLLGAIAAYAAPHTARPGEPTAGSHAAA